jgi:hypothetical protein
MPEDVLNGPRFGAASTVDLDWTRDLGHRRRVSCHGCGHEEAALPIVSASAAIIGWTADPGHWRAMGLLLFAITALYVSPRTAVLGAILLTGYLGGAVATHARIGDPLFSHALFGVYLGIALWGALWLRAARVRNLLPVS